MVKFNITSNVHKIIDVAEFSSILTINQEWFDEYIEITTSSNKVGGILVYDFDFSESATVQATLDGGLSYNSINEGSPVTGRQSRYIRVKNGDKLNFRSPDPVTLKRVVVGEV